MAGLNTKWLFAFAFAMAVMLSGRVDCESINVWSDGKGAEGTPALMVEIPGVDSSSRNYGPGKARVWQHDNNRVDPLDIPPTNPGHSPGVGHGVPDQPPRVTVRRLMVRNQNILSNGKGNVDPPDTQPGGYSGSSPGMGHGVPNQPLPSSRKLGSGVGENMGV